MKQKKILVLSLATLLTAGMVVGCKNDKDPSSASSSQNNPTSNVEPSTSDGSSLSESIDVSSSESSLEDSSSTTSEDNSSSSISEENSSSSTSEGGSTSSTSEDSSSTGSESSSIPDEVVTMGYATADTAPVGWSYFNNPEWWEGTSVIVSKAYSDNNATHFSYAYDSKSNPAGASAAWGCQLFYKNDTLTEGQTYRLTFVLNSSKAGKITVNGQEVNLVVGDNNIDLTVIEGTDGYNKIPSLNITFSMQFGNGEAEIKVSNLNWEKLANKLKKPEGLVYNASVNTLAWANDNAATSYVVYYYNEEGEEVASETITNGGVLTKTSELADGLYTIKLKAIGDGVNATDSDLSDAKTIVVGEYEEDQTRKDMTYAINADTAPAGWSYFNNPEWWEGSSVIVNEAYSENGVAHFSYAYDSKSAGPGAAWGCQLFYKNVLVQPGDYTLTMKVTTDKAGTITIFDKEVNLVVGENDINLPVTLGADGVMKLVFPMTYGEGSANIQISDINYGKAGGGEVIDPIDPTTVKDVKFTVIQTYGEHWVKVNYETEADLTTRVYVKVNGTQFDSVFDGTNVMNIFFTTETGYPAGNYVVEFFNGEGKVFAQGTITIEGTPTPDPGDKTKLTNVEGAVISKDGSGTGYVFQCANVTGADGYVVEFRKASEVVKTQTVTNGGALSIISELDAGTYEVYVKAVDSTGTHDDSDFAKLPTDFVKEGATTPVDPVDPTTVKDVKFTVMQTYGEHWVKVKYETEADLTTRVYVKVNGTQFDSVFDGTNVMNIFFTTETGYPAGNYVVEFFNGEGKVFAQGTITIEGTPTPNPGEETKLKNVEGGAINPITDGYIFACASVTGADGYVVEFRKDGAVVKTQTVINGGVLTIISELDAGTYEVYVKAVDSTGVHEDSDYVKLPTDFVKEAA